MFINQWILCVTQHLIQVNDRNRGSINFLKVVTSHHQKIWFFFLWSYKIIYFWEFSLRNSSIEKKKKKKKKLVKCINLWASMYIRTHNVEKREILSHHQKNNSSNQLLSNLFSKTVTFTKILPKMNEREFPCENCCKTIWRNIFPWKQLAM